MKMFLNMLKGGFIEERKCLTVLHHAIDENSSCEIKCRFSANYSTFCEKEEGGIFTIRHCYEGSM